MFVEAVSSILIHQIYISSSSGSQLKHSFPLYLCAPVSESRKISFLTFSNHVKAYAIKELLAISKFVLDILDDCKCSENFMAPTVIVPIHLNATRLIHTVQ
jgi:hypothetical protein